MMARRYFSLINARRDFLIKAGLLVGGAALMGVPAVMPLFAASFDSRALAGGTSALELDGQFMGLLKSAEGGFPRTEVFYEPAGSNVFMKKHIGQTKYQDIDIETDSFMPKPLYDWIAAALTMSNIRKNGAIITMDFNHVEQNLLQFNNAFITEFCIPACDARLEHPVFSA